MEYEEIKSYFVNTLNLSIQSLVLEN